MNKKIILFFFIVFLVTAIVVALFGKNYQSGSNLSQKLEPISVRLAWVHQAQFAGFYWAKEKGLYAKEGLDVTLNEFQQDLNQATELFEGKSDFSILSASEVLDAISSGKTIKAVAAVYQKTPYAFIARKETGIKSAADFKGKKLGIGGGNEQAKAVYQAILSSHGISEKDVTFVSLGFDTPDDVEKRNADVFDLYRTDQTYLVAQKGIEYNLIAPEQSGLEVHGDVIAVSNESLSSNPERIQKFVRASMKGWEEAIKEENREEALNIIAKYESELYKDRAHEKHILEESISLIQPTGGRRLGDMQFVSWNKYYQALLAANVLKKTFDIKEAFTTEFLD